MVLVLETRSYWALRTLSGFKEPMCPPGPTLAPFSSIFTLGLERNSLAVAQFRFLKPFKAQTICIVVSTRLLGFDMDLISRMLAFDSSLRAESVSSKAFSRSFLVRSVLKCSQIC